MTKVWHSCGADGSSSNVFTHTHTHTYITMTLYLRSHHGIKIILQWPFRPKPWEQCQLPLMTKYNLPVQGGWGGGCSYSTVYNEHLIIQWFFKTMICVKSSLTCHFIALKSETFFQAGGGGGGPAGPALKTPGINNILCSVSPSVFSQRKGRRHK